MNKKYHEYKAAGLCRRCGNQPLQGKIRCQKCHEEHLQYQRKSKAKAVADGRCRYCLVSKKIVSHSMCELCLKKHREKGRHRSALYRRLCIENYGGKCVCCGDTRQKYLQLDHVNNDGKVHRQELSKNSKTSRGGNLYNWAVVNDYPPRLQLLCANCHQAKTCFGGCTEEDHPL